MAEFTDMSAHWLTNWLDYRTLRGSTEVRLYYCDGHTLVDYRNVQILYSVENLDQIFHSSLSFVKLLAQIPHDIFPD